MYFRFSLSIVKVDNTVLVWLVLEGGWVTCKWFVPLWCIQLLAVVLFPIRLLTFRVLGCLPACWADCWDEWAEEICVWCEGWRGTKPPVSLSRFESPMCCWCNCCCWVIVIGIELLPLTLRLFRFIFGMRSLIKDLKVLCSCILAYLSTSWKKEP